MRSHIEVSTKPGHLQKPKRKMEQARSLPEHQELKSSVSDNNSLVFNTQPTGRIDQSHSHPTLPSNLLNRSQPINISTDNISTDAQIIIVLEKADGKRHKLRVPRSADTVFISPREPKVSYSQRNSHEQSPAITAFSTTSTSTSTSESSDSSTDKLSKDDSLKVVSDEDLYDQTPHEKQSSPGEQSKQQIEPNSFMKKLRIELSRKNDTNNNVQTKTAIATERTSLIQSPDEPADFIAIERDTNETDPAPNHIESKTGSCQTKLKSALRGTVAHAASVPTALNAFANPFGITPDQLSEAILKAASAGEWARATAEGLASLVMNGIQLDFSLQTVYDDLRKSLPRTFESPKDAIINLTSIFGSINAAIAAFAIAYAALALPVGAGIGIGSGVVSLATTLVTRYLGAASALKAFFMLFNDNANLQTTFVDQIEHLDLKNEQLNNIFELALCNWIVEILNKDQQGQHILSKLISTNDSQSVALPLLTDEELAYLQEKLQLDDNSIEIIGANFAKILTTIAADPNSSISIKETEWSESIIKASGSIVDVGLGVLAAYGVAPVFLQKGFDGWRILLGYAGLDLNSYATGTKQWIGAAASCVTSLMYFFWGVQFRTLCSQLATHLQQSWQDSTSKFVKDSSVATIMTGLAILAWNGPKNIAIGVTHQLNNIAGITPNTSLAEAIEILNLVGGGVFVNLGSGLKKYLQVFGSQPDATNLTVEQFLERLKKPNQHVVSPGVAEQFGLFAQTVAPKNAANTFATHSNNADYSPAHIQRGLVYRGWAR